MKKNLLSLVLVLFLAGCNQSSVQTTTPIKQNTTTSKKITVVTSFYPLAFMTEQIVGDMSTVINLAGSVDVHAYTPTPQDIIALNNADLVIVQGAELEPWADDILPALREKGVKNLAVAEALPLLKNEEHDEHEADHDEEGHEDHHDHGEFDPHTWLDPVRAQQMVDEILAALVAINSDQETLYTQNAVALKARFATLDESFKNTLAQCTNEEVIVSHNAYSYLANRYDFVTHAITGFAPTDEPSAKVLAALKAEAEEGITHILIEENNIKRFADTLVAETSLTALPVNPLGRGTFDASKDFFDIMTENLDSFKTALACQ